MQDDTAIEVRGRHDVLSDAGKRVGEIVAVDHDGAPYRWTHFGTRRSGDAWTTEFAVNQIRTAEAGKPALRP